MKRLLVFGLLIVCCAGAAQPLRGQSRYPSQVYLGPACPLTVNDIIKMSQAGVHDDSIIAEFRKCDQHFDLSKSQLARLTSAGLSQHLIQAMIQPPSGVDDVIKLVQAGVNEDFIIEQVSKRYFDLSPNDLIQLKKAGVSDRVVQAMIDPTRSVAPTAVQKRSTATPGTAPQPPTQQSAPQPSTGPPVMASVSGVASPSAVVPPSVQDSAPVAPPPQTQPAAAPPQQLLVPAEVPPNTVPNPPNDGKIRVFVTDRPITEVISMIQGGSYGTAHASGYANGNQASYSGSAYQASHVGGVTNDQRGGADPRTLEVSGDLSQECHIPNLVVTTNPGAADYILDFRRRGGERTTWFLLGGLSGLAMSAAVKVDHAGLYRPNGDLVIAAKARTVGGAVKELCPHIAP